MVSGNTLRKFIPWPKTLLPVVKLLLGGSGEGCRKVRGVSPVPKPNSVVRGNIVGVGVHSDPGL